MYLKRELSSLFFVGNSVYKLIFYVYFTYLKLLLLINQKKNFEVKVLR